MLSGNSAGLGFQRCALGGKHAEVQVRREIGADILVGVVAPGVQGQPAFQEIVERGLAGLFPGFDKQILPWSVIPYF